MEKFWYLIYNFIILPLLYSALKIAGLFNEKIKRGIQGRKKIFETLIIDLLHIDKNKKLIWFHSSSLGEFEQAKPIIEEIKRNKDVNILVTFFSPSGYENSKKYPFADLVTYMPFDSGFKANRFLNLIHPDLAVIMRYDIWPNHIRAMKKNNITNFLVDATLNPNSYRKLFIIRSFHKILFNYISKILTVTERDKNEFLKFVNEKQKVKVIGDTRFDRVHQKSITAKQKGLINPSLLKDKKVIVAGSTWEKDEEVLFPVFKKLSKYEKDVLFIVVPHEPTIVRLEGIENELSGELKTIRFSHLNLPAGQVGHYSNEQVIIVDSIGILLTLYSYAHIAFVGGSFKQNIHNTLEAAVYGIPVIYGPKIDKSVEAKQLAKLGGGIVVENTKQAYREFRKLLLNEHERKAKGEVSYNFVHENLGATSRILEEIYKVI